MKSTLSEKKRKQKSLIARLERIETRLAERGALLTEEEIASLKKRMLMTMEELGDINDCIADAEGFRLYITYPVIMKDRNEISRKEVYVKAA